MKTLALKDGDLVFENGDFKLVSDEQEVIQCIEIDLGTNLGDWFLNLMKGTDQSLLLEKTTDDEARTEIIRVLGNEERIAEINSVEIRSDTKTRVRAIYFDVTLINGNSIVQEVIMDGS